MNTKIADFLSALEREMDVATLVDQISDGVLQVPDRAAIEVHLAPLSESEKTRVQTLLVNATLSISSYTSELQKEMEEIKKQMELNNDMSRACESYGTSQVLGNKKDK